MLDPETGVDDLAETYEVIEHGDAFYLHLSRTGHQVREEPFATEEAAWTYAEGIE